MKTNHSLLNGIEPNHVLLKRELLKIVIIFPAFFFYKVELQRYKQTQK